MKLCAVSESLGHLPFSEAAKASADLGLMGLEVGTGNWNAAPHARLQSLLESKEERRKFLEVLERNGLELAALNCNGNQLHPVDGERQSKVVFDTVRVAELLGIDKIVLMSGLPAGGPNDLRPNWVTCAWPTEYGDLLEWQWREKVIPYWQEQAAFAANGVHYQASLSFITAQIRMLRTAISGGQS